MRLYTSLLNSSKLLQRSRNRPARPPSVIYRSSCKSYTISSTTSNYFIALEKVLDLFEFDYKTCNVKISLKIVLMSLNDRILLLKYVINYLSFHHSTKCKTVDHSEHELGYHLDLTDSGGQGITTSSVTLAVIVCLSLLLVSCKCFCISWIIF